MRGVLKLAKLARATVGFLPDAAFTQRARQGTLLVALSEESTVGYVLYDLPRQELRIVHLVVATAWRGRQIARRLVDRLESDHPERHGIYLHCRNDFDADRLWPRLDFEPRGERPGRSFDGRPLTRWYRSFGHPDLFTYSHEVDTRPVAALDACVFFDLVADDQASPVHQLKADWLGEYVRLAVTGHLGQEIHRGKDPTVRREQAAATEPFRLKAIGRAEWLPVFERFLERHPGAPARDHDDLTHAAQAIVAGASWLVTDDRAFRNRYRDSASEIGALKLTSPAALLREIDQLAREDRYRPIELANTSVQRREVTAEDLAEIAPLFVSHSEGERINSLRAQLEVAAARTQALRLEIVEVGRRPRALLAWEVTGDRVAAHFVRVTTGVGAATIGRHLLALLRDEALSAGRDTVEIEDQHVSASVVASLTDEGFGRTPTGNPKAHLLRGSHPIRSIDATRLGIPVPDLETSAADTAKLAAVLERWLNPARITGAGLPTYVVPIRHGWATDLLDGGLADLQLLPRPWGLGLRRELVYYRSTRNPSSLQVPARLLWYVSGTGHGAGAIRAVSQLTEVVVDDSERLYYRFRALGVYKKQDVARVADPSGRAMAMRFSSTVPLERPVSLRDYRDIVAGDPTSRRVVLQSIRPISEHVFDQIMMRSQTP